MSVEALWRRYAACWSLPGSDRAVELPACVVGDVTYLDPQETVAGIDGLVSYMEGFVQSLPGASFEIVGVLHHHDRSLARWELRGEDGNVLQAGASTAVHPADGRLAAITGFFDETLSQPDNKQAAEAGR